MEQTLTQNAGQNMKISDLFALLKNFSDTLAQKNEYMTIDQFCKELQISEVLAGQICKSKGFPACKFGREWRIHRSSLAKWVLDGRRK